MFGRPSDSAPERLEHEPSSRATMAALGPNCSLRDHGAFLRDTAVFSAGRGLSYGDVYRIRVPGIDLHVVTDPDLAEEILVRRADDFQKSRVYWGELHRMVGPALGSTDGEPWEYLHRIEQPFFTPRAAQRYIPAAEAITTSYLTQLTERIGAGTPVTVIDEFAKMNVLLLLDVLFGAGGAVPYGEIAKRIADAESIIAWRSKFPWRPITGYLSGVQRRVRDHEVFFDTVLQGELESSTSRPDRDRLIDALRRVTEDTNGPAFPSNLVRNEAIIHLGAGTETHSVAEGWTLYLLWKHPHVLERLRQELDRVTGGACVTRAHLPELVYTRQVVRESLRLYPPSYGLLRDCVRSTELRGEQVQPRQVFFISVCGIHRNPRLWSDPEAFDPERFAPGRAEAIPKFHYLPFGAGKHVCIGQHLALPCLLLTVGQFAQRFDWRFADPSIGFVGLATLKPAGRFEAWMTPRADSPS